MKYESFEIINNTQIFNLSGVFDKAVEVPVFYGENKEETPRYKGIYNKGSGELAQVASKNYQIIQHEDVTISLYNTLERKGINCFGRIDNFINSVRFDLIFGSKESPVKDDSNGGVMIGIRVKNSFDKSTSFSLEMYGFRMVCQNGMSLGKALNSIKEVTIHCGKEKTRETIESIIDSFIDRVIASSDKLQKLVDNSIKDKLDTQKIGLILSKLIKTQKHRDKIGELLGISFIEVEENGKTTIIPFVEENKILSRYDFYNALTNYISHNTLGLSVENNLQEKAQEVLGKRFEELLKIEVP